jgi:REP element-mobilizing transposase RayT
MLQKKRRPTLPPRLRAFKCGHVYHVYQRASQRQRVFDSQAQLVYYLDRLDILARRYQVRIHAFCLMSNHVHFMFEPTRKKHGISRLMQHLQSYHARFVNGLRRTDGHLWRHHFHAKPIKSPGQYRNTLLYIEQNPVAAGLCERAHKYPFSSAIAHTSDNPMYSIARHEYAANVKLYLDRWRKEFEQPTDWPASLRGPCDTTDDDPQDIGGHPLLPPHRATPIPPRTVPGVRHALARGS